MSRLDTVSLLIACVLFLLASSWQVSLPGLQYDECIAASAAVNFVRDTENAEPMQIRPSVVRVFGRPLPLMQMTYIGPVKMLLYIPLFWGLGISPATVRLLPIAVATLSLVLTYLICIDLFGRRTAVVSSLLLALDPSFVFYVTRDVGPAALQILLKLGGLLFFVRWWRQGKVGFFAAGALIFGLGISHKADFVWVIGGLLLALLVLRPGETLRKLDLVTLVWGTGSFLLGALPLVALNLASGARTFAPFLRSLASEAGQHLMSVPSHLGRRLEQVAGLLSGELVGEVFTGGSLGLPAVRLVVPLVLTAGLVSLLILVLRRRQLQSPALAGGLLLYLVSVLVVSCFSPTQLSGHHLLALYPMLHIAMGLALVEWGRHGLAQRLRIDVLLLAALLAINGLAVVSIHRLLSRTGGSGFWSDRIYDLSQDLVARNHTVALMDWGFTNNLIVASRGELRMQPVYRQFWRHPVSVPVLERFVNERWLYLFHSRRFTWYRSVLDRFCEAADQKGLRLVKEKSFYQRDGREVYRIFRLQRKETDP